jgi:hypothetical protein
VNRIVWKTGLRGEQGSVGDYLLFRIGWDAVKTTPDRWLLLTELPLSLDRERFGTFDEAKAYAEDVVEEFVRRLGTQFAA